jgi:hypothetical protein
MKNNFKSWRGFYIALEEIFPYKSYLKTQNEDYFK